jgi:tetratricopeptide (TPR) repeat protein
MVGLILLAGLLPGADAGTVALSDAELLQRAETAFHAGVQLRQTKPGRALQSFREAAADYEELHRRGAENADLERNAGNAWLLAGDLPRAILAYRRGLRLAPNDGDLREHLAAAREEVVYPPPGGFGRPPVDQHPPWLPRLGPAVFLVAALGVYILAWLAMTRWAMTHRRWLLAAGIAAFAVALVLGAGWAWLQQEERDETSQPLVVIQSDGVLLRGGNGLSYPALYKTPVNRGVEARLLARRGDWLKIRLADGDSGWVPGEYALVDSD